MYEGFALDLRGDVAEPVVLQVKPEQVGKVGEGCRDCH